MRTMSASFIRNHRASDHVGRFCSRCSKELTDSASREAGIGPICRRKNNDLFAKGITANLAMASALVMGLESELFHAQCKGFQDWKDTFFRKYDRARRSNQSLTALYFNGSDWREIVDWIDYSMSFPMSTETRRNLVSIVDALGYTGLASIFRGDACMSKARIYIEGNRVFLEGKACKAGWKAFRTEVPGVRTPRFRGDRTPYSAHVSHVDKFLAVANRHWPFNEVEFDRSTLDLSSFAADEAAAPAGPRHPVAKFSTVNPGWFKVEVPWHGTRTDMMNMIARFKQLPRRERVYDPNTRCWSFKNAHFHTILGMVEIRYTVDKQGVNL